jgi:hypothetical protein
MSKDEIASALRDCLLDEDGRPVLLYVAETIHELAISIKKLGLSDASTPMGAIEVLSSEIKEGAERLASSLSDIAGAIEKSKS